MYEYGQVSKIEEDAQYFLGITDYIKKRYRELLRLRKPKERESNQWSEERGLAEFDDVAQTVGAPQGIVRPKINIIELGSYYEKQNHDKANGVGGWAEKDEISLHTFEEPENDLISKVRFWHESGHYLVFHDPSWEKLPIYHFSTSSDMDAEIDHLRDDGPTQYYKKVLYEMCLGEAMADWTSLEVLKKKIDKYRYPSKSLGMMARGYLEHLGIFNALKSTAEERQKYGQISVENVWKNIGNRITLVYDDLNKEKTDDGSGKETKVEHKIRISVLTNLLFAHGARVELMYLAHQYSLMKVIELSEKLETKELPKILEYLMNNPDYLFEGLDFDKLK